MRVVLYQASPVTAQLPECGCLAFHVLYTWKDNWGKPAASPTLAGLHSKDACMSVCLWPYTDQLTARGNNLF